MFDGKLTKCRTLYLSRIKEWIPPLLLLFLNKTIHDTINQKGIYFNELSIIANSLCLTH
jgi:hypothetical protein